jgi:REP-associated tyrosine transposase
MPDRYRRNKGSVTSIRYHVIWIPRRRRKVLVGDVARRLIALLRDKAAEIDVNIMHLAVEPDHIHLFLDCPQHLAISQIVFRFKGYTSRILRKEFEHLRRMPSMWTTSYFASTAGAVSEQTISKYINSRGTGD